MQRLLESLSKRVFVITTILVVVVVSFLLYGKCETSNIDLEGAHFHLDSSVDRDNSHNRQPRVGPPQEMGTIGSTEAEPWQEEDENLARQECWDACGSPCVPGIAGSIRMSGDLR